ncbi:MAG: FHA domain-containing protein [Kiritimatiellae bacterium]|nr:FHA domain-containing protein [Kiritimatiellia bacterium]
MIYRLIFLNGPRTGERITVAEQPMCLGTDADCAVCVEDAEMARRHAEVFQKGDELFIRDLGSMNKILVNKHETQEARIKHGDEIELGRTRLVVQALVQADVEGRTRARRRRRQTTWAVMSLLLIGVVLALSARYVPREQPIEEITVTDPALPIKSVLAPTTNVNTLTEDIRTLRNDLRTIQDSVKRLNPPPPTALPTLTPPPSPRTAREEAEELIGAARDARESKHFTEADRLLAHIQNLDPDFLAAYEERALLFEEQGRTGDAAMQWSEILRRSTESPIYQKAVTERIRLSRFSATQQGPPELRILTVQQNRFPGNADYDEMRVLKIALRSESAVRIDPDKLHLDVVFYDRNTGSDAIEISDGRVEQQKVELSPDWSAESERVLTATCVIPKGLREKQEAEGQPHSYYGYYVRLLYNDQQLDETARPRTLLAAAKTDAKIKRVAERPADSAR